MTNRPGDSLSDLDVGRAEIDIVGDERKSSSNRRDSGRGMGLLRTEIRPAVGVCPDFFANTLKLPFSDISQVLPRGYARRLLVEINRNRISLGDFPGNLPREFNALLHGDA
jgi:hypothetical protein